MSAVGVGCLRDRLAPTIRLEDVCAQILAPLASLPLKRRPLAEPF